MYKGGRLKKPFSLTGLSPFFAIWTTGNTAFTVCGKAADCKSTLCTGGGWPNSLTCDSAPTYVILMCYLVWLWAFCFLEDTFCYQWHNTGRHHVLLVSERSLTGFRVTLRLCWGEEVHKKSYSANTVNRQTRAPRVQVPASQTDSMARVLKTPFPFYSSLRKREDWDPTARLSDFPAAGRDQDVWSLVSLHTNSPPHGRNAGTWWYAG